LALSRPNYPAVADQHVGHGSDSRIGAGIAGAAPLFGGHTSALRPLDGEREESIRSTLIDFGTPEGESAMARTVGTPAAVGARMILEGEIDLTGVHIPELPEIYEPVLDELERLGIAFEEWGL